MPKPQPQQPAKVPLNKNAASKACYHIPRSKFNCWPPSPRERAALPCLYFWAKAAVPTELFHKNSLWMYVWSIQDRPGKQHMGVMECRLWSAGDHKTESPLDMLRTSPGGFKQGLSTGLHCLQVQELPYTHVSLSPKFMFR